MGPPAGPTNGDPVGVTIGSAGRGLVPASRSMSSRTPRLPFRKPYMRDRTSEAAAVAGDALRVVLVEGRLDALEPHADAWDRLALEAPVRMPMLSHAWVASHLEHFVGPGESWRCLFAYEGPRLVGVLPLVRSPHPRLGDFRPVLHAPHDLHTLTGDALLAAGDERRVLRAMLAALARVEPRRFCVEFLGVREGSRTLRALDGGVRGGLVVRSAEGMGRRVPISGTYEEFSSRLSRNFRQHLTQARNRMGRVSGVEFRFLAGPEASAEGLDRFLPVEASGWKGREGTAILSSPTLVAFYRALARRLAARGWLEWHFLEVGGKVAAAQMAVRFGRSLVIHKIAYAEEFGRYSPGSLLWQRCARRAFETRDVDEVNWLSDTPWMANWRMERFAYHDARVYPLRILPLAMGLFPARTRMVAKRFRSVVRLVRRLRGEDDGRS